MTHRLPRENVYICETCAGHTVTVDVDEGVTPFMIQCRAKDLSTDIAIIPGCKGMAYSEMYPKGPRPEHISPPKWEWYKPTPDEFEKLSEEMKNHIYRGGLNIRSRTDKEPFYHK